MELEQFFKSNPSAALAFSGGVDSAYLLYAAKKYGADVTAYYVRTPFQPQFEYDDAVKLAEALNMPMRTILMDVLEDPEITANPANRCYYCKRRIFSAILEAAHADGYRLILDGTNASDDASDRPGMVALRELQVRSPLRECNLTKDEIRRLSKEAGLFTWDKPAYACLATRVQNGAEITVEDLQRVEQSEEILRKMGYFDLRIRLFYGAARVQLPENQLKNADIFAIRKALSPYFDHILLDLRGR